MKNLTLIIPAKHEEESLPQVLNEIKDYECNIIIILEESDIKTINSVKNFNCKILYQSGNGFGNALIEGMNSSQTEYTCIFNADGSFDPKYLKEMMKILVKSKSASVTGSRMKNLKKALNGGMPIYKFIGNIFLTKLFNFFYSTSFSDCHTGYWFYDLKKVKRSWLKNFDDGFLFDLDMRLKLTKENFIIKEIPIETRYGSEWSSVHLNYALRFFLNTVLGKFKK